MKFILFLIFLTMSIVELNAQQLTNVDFKKLLPYESEVNNIIVKQLPSIYTFLESERDYNATNKTIPGWRVQIYFSTGRGAKEGAEETRDKFMEDNPGTNAYITYFAPYFKVYVGNFRSKRNAANFRIQLLTVYSEAWLVQDKIEWPEL